MMRLLPVIILIGCFAGCKDKDGLPDGILKKDKMQAVFWDVIQAEAFTTQFIKKDSSKNAQLEDAKLQQQIFAIYKITKEDFYNSYNYYAAHVELMHTLLDSMTSKGEREKYSTLYNRPVKAVPARISLMPLPEPVPPKPIPMWVPTIYVAPVQAPVTTPVPVVMPPVKPAFFRKPAGKPVPAIAP